MGRVPCSVEGDMGQGQFRRGEGSARRPHVVSAASEYGKGNLATSIHLVNPPPPTHGPPPPPHTRTHNLRKTKNRRKMNPSG